MFTAQKSLFSWCPVEKDEVIVLMRTVGEPSAIQTVVGGSIPVHE